MDKILDGDVADEQSPPASPAIDAPAEMARPLEGESNGDAKLQAGTEARVEPPVRAAESASPVSSSPLANLPPERIVHLDFARLAAAGFLTPNQPTTRQSEEYQQIKRRLLSNIAAGSKSDLRAANLILITSSVPNEGKTFTSVNLAISLAMEVDHTVLLIDTDLMKRDLSRVLGVSDRKGLFDLLANPELRLEDLLVRTSMRNLVLLPVGTQRDGSTELLASMRMRELTKEIATRYHDRVVLFDSPPVLATTTATAMAPLVGQLVLVAEAGSTKQETVRETLQRLDRATITGVILNKAKQAAAASYEYYGYYRSR
jgi:receptor protein-tyrosine kinase